ncbi:MAG: DUF4364 family protein [Clostridia bacterium]|nr:DUF4364 family protein [Clostridia bacterium]
MDFANDSTTNKLILLYVLDKMEIPLTENSILEICCSYNNWINYMDLKDILYQLLETKLVYRPNTQNNEERYNITYNGRTCLSQFYTRIPASMRDAISDFAKNKKMHYKRTQEYVGRYYKNIDGSYTVNLRIVEPHTTDSYFNLEFKVPTRASAINTCKKWRETAASVYEQIYSKLIEN